MSKGENRETLSGESDKISEGNPWPADQLPCSEARIMAETSNIALALIENFKVSYPMSWKNLTIHFILANLATFQLKSWQIWTLLSQSHGTICHFMSHVQMPFHITCPSRFHITCLFSFSYHMSIPVSCHMSRPSIKRPTKSRPSSPVRCPEGFRNFFYPAFSLYYIVIQPSPF
jgi:hypothetical protein